MVSYLVLPQWIHHEKASLTCRTSASSDPCVATGTVPRPLFVEEFGLKRLMETSGTSLPMSRADFEAGRWASLVTTAWEMGRERKAAHRRAHIDRKEPQVKASTVIAQELERFMASED